MSLTENKSFAETPVSTLNSEIARIFEAGGIVDWMTLYEEGVVKQVTGHPEFGITSTKLIPNPSQPDEESLSQEAWEAIQNIYGF